MSDAALLGAALLSLIPGAGLLASYPRRRAAAWAALLLCAAGAVAVVFWAEPRLRLPAAAAAIWSLGACLYALRLMARNASERGRRGNEVSAALARRRETARLLAEVKAKGLEAGRQERETQALYGIIKGLAEALTWEEIRPKIEYAVEQYLGVSGYALYVSESAGGECSPLTVRNLAGSPGASWATLARCLQVQRREATRPELLETPERAVAMPVSEGSEVLGYFYARVPEGVDGPALQSKAWTFAAEIVFAFKRVRLFQEVEKLSRTDGLTGVRRRGDFDERIQEEAVRAKTFKTSFALLLLDIDHFKQLNDRYGHPFGDQVLRRVGEMLNSLVYETDYVARYGGEEFVVLLPRAEAAGVLRKAEAIRRAVESEEFSIALDAVRVTVSIGVAHYPRDAGSPTELVAAADAAMYQAKSQGRNRVVDYSTIRA